jgi:hypothetical protein
MWYALSASCSSHLFSSAHLVQCHHRCHPLLPIFFTQKKLQKILGASSCFVNEMSEHFFLHLNLKPAMGFSV